MPINAGYEYFEAEKKYIDAKNPDEKILALEDLIRKAPHHKSSENLLAGLRLRLKKLKSNTEKAKKVGKGKAGIKKSGYQVALVGLTNSGKSSLLGAMTNAKPRISANLYSTFKPELGTMDYEGVKAQVVDLPSIGSSGFDIGIINNADCLLLVVERFEDISKVEAVLRKSTGIKMIVFNKIDLLSVDERRRVEANFRSKRIEVVLVSASTKENIDLLKRAIFLKMKVIRVYTKEPGKPTTGIPVVLPIGSIVKDVAESILKGFSQNVRETRITGPSAKFANQKVGLQHILRDRDMVEFHTR